MPVEFNHYKANVRSYASVRILNRTIFWIWYSATLCHSATLQGNVAEWKAFWANCV